MTMHAWRLPGLGVVMLGARDAHRRLVWMAAGGLVLATVLGVVGMPPVDLHETSDQYILTAEVPGLRREDLDIRIQDGRLTVSGVRRNDDAVAVAAGSDCIEQKIQKHLVNLLRIRGDLRQVALDIARDSDPARHFVELDLRGGTIDRLRKVEGQVRGIQRMIEEGKDCEQVLRTNALALQRTAFSAYDYNLLALSVAGPANAIRAVSAVLRDKKAARVITTQVSTFAEHTEAVRWADVKFTVKKTPLSAFGLWHLVAVADEPTLLLDYSEQALWVRLRSPEFTTPLLKHWVPWLRQRLLDLKWLVPLDGRAPTFDLIREHGTADPYFVLHPTGWERPVAP